MATREEWKKKLVEWTLPEEVVNTFLASIKDEDLVRMKDMSKEEFMELVKSALVETDPTTEVSKEKKPGDTEDEEDEDEEDEDKKKKAASTCKDESETLKDLADYIVGKVTEAIGTKEFEVEVPELKEILTAVQALKERMDTIEATLKEATQIWKDLSGDETERLKAIVKNLSPAQKNRLRQSVTPEDAALKILEKLKEAAGGGSAQPDGVVIKDASGNEYATFSDMLTGNPKKQP